MPDTSSSEIAALIADLLRASACSTAGFQMTLRWQDDGLQAGRAACLAERDLKLERVPADNRNSTSWPGKY